MFFEANNKGIMTIEGIDSIDMMFVAETGNGASNQKNFTVSEHKTIEWVGGGTPIVALERPDLSIVRGEPLDGSRYTLHFTINAKQNLQSHRNSGLDGPMGVVSVSLLDEQSKVLLDMPRYSLLEFWCGENNVERWHPEKTTQT